MNKVQSLKKVPNARLDWRETEDGKYFSYKHSNMHSLYARELDGAGNPIHGGNDEWQGLYHTVREMNDSLK